MDNVKYNEANKKLKKYRQEHLFKFMNDLSSDQADVLIEQVLSIDFDLVKELYINAADNANLNSEINTEPLECTEIEKLSAGEISKLNEIGNKAIKDGKVCAVTVAGGQGTRLGHNGPKGTFDIGLPSGRSMFNILCDRLKILSDKNDSKIPWYIMTSEENNADTIRFFEENNYFGYCSQDIVFFKQCMMPVVDAITGKILLKEKDSIAMGADGHGGVFKAMVSSNVLKDMAERGCEYVFLCGIDNVLVRMADPLFIGFASLENTDCASKGVLKRDPYEKAGIFCLNNGKPAVIEYTELSDEIRFSKNENGDYKYGDINLLSYVFKFEVLNKIAEFGLPYHTALKKCNHINEEGMSVAPETENAYKFETFLFDAFGQLKNMSVLRGTREKEFAPVKNKTGADSPETAVKLLLSAGEN